VGLEAGSQLKSQGKWLGVGGTFLWDFTYLCWNLTEAEIKQLRELNAPPVATERHCSNELTLDHDASRSS
jgi:hypothetical protein